MRTEFKKLFFVLVTILCLSAMTLADWNAGDPYKMHFPQMPNPDGWDICLHEQMIADDFMCSETGPITDIHFWVSWQEDMEEWASTTFTVQIWSNLPGGPCGGGMPGMPLWTWNGGGNFVVRQPAYQGNEGWHCPATGLTLRPDHYLYWQINIKNIPEPFIQQAGTTYWLVIRANKPVWPPAVGWKTSLNRFQSCSLWSAGASTWQPVMANGETVDQAFVITSTTPESDLGDAPDSTNNYGLAMTAYSALGTVANYPTVYLDPTGLPPFGPIHRQPQAAAWLGQNVTLENEADIGLDQDPTNNIIPLTNTPDQDLADDGILNMPLTLPHCLLTNFKYQINVVNPAVGLYVNVWFDWNRDGDWDDTATCGLNSAPEWAVPNQFFAAGSLPVGLNTVTTTQFRPWHPAGAQQPTSEIWMRITLSEQPCTSGGGTLGYGGSGPANGYVYGETEDYRFVPITECLKSTALEYAAWVSWNRPDCWCCRRQCRGDADCIRTGLYWVSLPDLNIVKASYNKADAACRLIPNCICVDFDHTKTGLYRVSLPDLNILKIWYNKTNVPCCDLDGDCILMAADKYNFWTN